MRLKIISLRPRRIESATRAHSRVSPRLHSQGDRMILPVASLVGRVITQDILVREIGGDLYKRRFQIGSLFWNIDRAAGLRRKLFHPALSRKVAPVRVVVVSGLHDVHLTIFRERPLNGRFEIRAARRVRSVRNDHNHFAAVIWMEIDDGVDDCVKQRCRTFRFAKTINRLLESLDVAGQWLSEIVFSGHGIDCGLV